MTIRKALLWLMLVSLGLSAVGGALAVLTAGSDVVWRVVGTGFAAAVAAGLLLANSLVLDREKARTAGLLGMGAVVLVFLLTLALIWDVAAAFTTGIGDEESIALTLLAVFLAALPAMLFLRLAHAEKGRWAGATGVTTSAVAFVVMLAGSWWKPAGLFRASDKLWGSAGIFGVFGVLMAASLGGLGTDRRHWRWVGVLASVVGLVLGLVGIWSEAQHGTFIMVLVCGLAVIVAHANLALLCPLKSGQEWVRVVTIAAVVIAAVLLDAGAWGSRELDWEAADRGAGAAGIVAACGSLALLILARLNRRMTAPKTPPSVKEISIVCPWCQRRQAVPLGESNCTGCGLRFRIAVEEPRCPACDYLLYMLQSDRCPECGTPIGAQAGAGANR